MLYFVNIGTVYGKTKHVSNVLKDKIGIVSMDTPNCEICQSTDTSWWCLHRALCLECAGGGLIECRLCNPDNKLFIVVTDKNGIKKIQFIN